MNRQLVRGTSTSTPDLFNYQHRQNQKQTSNINALKESQHNPIHQNIEPLKQIVPSCCDEAIFQYKGSNFKQGGDESDFEIREIFFMPCGHTLCEGCIQNSRKQRKIFAKPIQCSIQECAALYSVQQAAEEFIENFLVKEFLICVKNEINRIRALNARLVQGSQQEVDEKTVKKPNSIRNYQLRNRETVGEYFEKKSLSPGHSSKESDKVAVTCIHIFCSKLTYGLFCSRKCEESYDMLESMSE